MINFILCDDDEKITKIIKDIIEKILFPTSLEYKIHIFKKYDRQFLSVVNSNLENKIYILDIEVENISGIEISKKIRKLDWDSTIIILTAHYELEKLAYNSKLLLFDFISKFDIYKNKLKDTILLTLQKISKNDTLSFKIKKQVYNINYREIIYISYDNVVNKIKIKTYNKTYELNQTLKNIKSKLKGNFLYSHRACIVNIDNIKMIDSKNKTIIFKNDEEINLLSRKYLKGVKDAFF